MRNATRLMVLNDGSTWADVAGCRIVDVSRTRYEEIEMGDAKPGDFDQDFAACDVLAIFDEQGNGGVLLTDDERVLIHEGLNYLEENGAPGMPDGEWRGGTKKMERALEGIMRKLGL